MKKIIFFIATIFAFSACITINTIFPSGSIVSETREVNSFDKVSVSAGIQLIVSNGVQDVVVETYENIIDHVETYVRNNCLIVRPSNHVSFGGNSRIKIYVTAEYISSVDAAGGSNVYIPNPLVASKMLLQGSGGAKFVCENYGKVECKELELNLAGGGKADLLIDCEYLDAKSSGGSRLELEGYADIVDLNVSGGGNTEAYNLEVIELYAQMSGGAKAEVSVRDYISGEMSGGSVLRYKGAPGVHVGTSGGSRVIPVQ
ncbi:DUF2807 domain-containing protein [Paludibacter sp. 221]|uniref:head GIN domain-containing protein n=1 Tax=Paludibacter sp. 221 TaxID=2302939 RepID=UPI0013D61226|nr:head GIN domain-containing protein [Paludibacter sp. 221]NDV47232.1 DUF2807 domain-containing protein [Paludibacter sp. 221]